MREDPAPDSVSRMNVPPTRHRLVFTTLIVAAVTVLAEVLAAIFVSLFGDRLPNPDPEKYVARPTDAIKVHRVFDQEIGWINPYSTPYGERPRSHDYGRPLLALFGDSFTHADEVEDNETWAEFLAPLIASDVYNFGAGAYGLDQAVLRFERESKRRPTRLALLSFVGVDLDRCLTSFWKFYFPIGDFPLTKPRFTVRDEQLHFHPNPAETSEELAAAIQDPVFIERIGRDDPFYNPYALKPLRFPYIFSLANISLLRAAFSNERAAHPWEVPKHIQLAELLFLRFIAGARSQGIVPIIMHLPQSSEVQAAVRDDIVPPAVHQLERICAEQELTCWAPIYDAQKLGGNFTKLYTRGRAGGHLTVEGNRWLAHFVATRVARLE